MRYDRSALDVGWRRQAIDLPYFWQLFVRQWKPLVLVPAAFLVLGFGYLVVVAPTYSSTALVGVEAGDATSDTLSATITSHTATIASNEITSEVIDRLHLADDLSVDRGRLDRLISRLRYWFGIEAQVGWSEAEIRKALEDQVASTLDVERVEDSRIIGITYTAGTPEDATAVANAYAEVYVDSLERRSREAMDRRAAFLQSRVAEVERLAASSYGEARQIRSSDGPELWGFEDLDARTAWLTQARSEIEDAEAAVSARLSLLENTDDLEARKVAAFQVEGGPELVTAYEEASEKLQQLRERGAAQYLVAQLEVSVESLQGEMDRLIARARSSLEQERKILLARSDSINGDFEQALSQSSRRNWSEVLIAEHQAGVFQNIYADHLRELEVVYGRAGVVPLSVVARARPGADPSWPSNKLVLMLAVASGLVVGVGVAMLREWQASTRSADPALPERAQA
jgi:uncharacterized protein involved in exopolysaccharide biosynthesis